MIGEDSRFVLRDVEGTTYNFEFSADSHLNTELRKTFDAIAALEQGLAPD
jgi:hypothetical protein